MILTNLKKAIIFVLLLVGASLLWQGGYIKLKASLADWLINATWTDRTAGQVPPKPWFWADTRVVARLAVPGLGIHRFVMYDASGESLAFGPGSMISSQVPGGESYSLIAGHRDTHFKFLSGLELGDILEIDNYFGQHAQYRVSSTGVLNIEQDNLYIDPDGPDLTLVTCWPFDTLIPGGPLRYLVNAERIKIKS